MTVVKDPGDRAKIAKGYREIRALGFTKIGAARIMVELVNGHPSPSALEVFKLARKLSPGKTKEKTLNTEKYMDTQPLNINLDLSQIVTTVPLIADGQTVLVRLKNVTQGDRDGVAILKWEFVLAAPAQSQEGAEVRPGFPLFTNFYLDQEWLVQKMTRFIDALLGTGDTNNNKGRPPRPRFNAETVSQMLGAEAYARVTVSRSKKSDYVANDISSLIHKEDYEQRQAAA